MKPVLRLTSASFALALTTLSPASYATCWQAGKGPAPAQRNRLVPAEFKAAAFVVTGRVTGERHVSEPDDASGYAWTVYTVQVLETFKGKPQQTIQLLSENTSARFPMDIGKTYLLFVSQSPIAELAGQERLPTNYIDSCGNSALANDAKPTISAVRGLSTSQ